jgi:hypothetical protein
MTSLNKVWEDYKKPTPPKYRKIGDFALLLIPTIEAALATAPSEVMGEISKFYVGFACSVILVGIKFFSNTYTYPQENLGAGIDN